MDKNEVKLITELAHNLQANCGVPEENCVPIAETLTLLGYSRPTTVSRGLKEAINDIINTVHMHSLTELEGSYRLVNDGELMQALERADAICKELDEIKHTGQTHEHGEKCLCEKCRQAEVSEADIIKELVIAMDKFEYNKGQHVLDYVGKAICTYLKSKGVKVI